MKITNHLHVLRIDFEIPLTPEKKLNRFVNVVLVFGDKITLIDTGVKGSEKLIFDYILSQGRAISEIEILILSHAHPDHIGAAAAIRKATNCKIWAHSNEKDWIQNIDLQNKQRPVPGFYTLVDQSVKVDSLLEDNQVFKIQPDITLIINKAAGHSPGSVNILFTEDKVLFTADSVPLKNDIPNYSNFRELVQSLAFIKTRNDYEIMITSWTEVLTELPKIKNLITEGEEYLRMLDDTVKKCYHEEETEPLSRCKRAVGMLGLPPFLVNPIVDKAFESHFI